MFTKLIRIVRARHTIRLQGYDYSQSGMYFVTNIIRKKIKPQTTKHQPQ